ncbi:PEP-CTERM sorting domain-containing protein [Mariniblastus fucicola]|uniref:PEP-CTERM protein-sorting domain-containing protein n=1 Tax=Mariniblastus fucicola TaxID=980251 RepID=A0A5B9PEH9_9BACT|nr:PEP-CTERM sorting domain-containing protein [Mariniblastus fucicola]QEG21363.1 hypothetical protein MFFC18_12190 [Mariniblastus fucicola]
MQFRFGCFCVLLCLSLCCPAEAQVTIIQAAEGISFNDLGYNPVTGESTIISYSGPFDTRTYEVATLNSNRDGFDYTAPASLSAATTNLVLTGVSTDGSRLSGHVKDVDSINQGLTWLSTDLSNVVAIGRPDDNAGLGSQALGAWSGGVVGQFTNWLTKWDAESGFVGTSSFSSNSFVDVSANGELAVGNAVGGAAVWDGGPTVTMLAESFDTSDAFAISPDGTAIGGSVRNFDSFGRAVIWNGDNWIPTILLDENNEPVQGAVTELTDNGFAIGTGFEPGVGSFGFIYDPTSGTATGFNDWLIAQDSSLGFDSELIPSGANWDSATNTMRFVTFSGAYIEVGLTAVPEPGCLSLLVCGLLGLASRRRRLR